MQIPARKKLWQYPRVRFAAALLLGAVLVMLLAYILSGGSAEPAVAQRSLPGMECLPLYESLLREGSPGRPGTERAIEYVVIHETANRDAGADARNHAKFLQGGRGGSTSWHYTVDDSCVYRHIPDNEVAWHAGDRETPHGGNLCGIGVELCVNSDGDFEKAFDNGARLTAALLRQHSLPLSAVRQHADFAEKNCPQTIRDEGRWQEFLDRTEQYLDKLS